MLGELLSIVAPIYIAIGLGFAWARAGRRWDTELVTELIMTVGAPCLVFSSLVGLEVEPAAMAQMAGRRPTPDVPFHPRRRQRQDQEAR